MGHKAFKLMHNPKTMTSLIEKIRSLYLEHPLAREGFEGVGYPESFEHYISLVGSYPQKSLSLGCIDSYGLDLAILLSHLPARSVADSFGNDILIWAWVNSPDIHVKKKLCSGLSEIIQYDVDVLEKTRLAAWKYMQSNNTLLVKKSLDLIHWLNNGFCIDIDVPSYIRSFPKDGVQLSDKRCREYSLAPLNTREKNTWGYSKEWNSRIPMTDKHISIFLDTYVGMCLNYKGIPNAIVGYFIPDPDILMIKQLQGVRPKRRDDSDKNIQTLSSRGLAPIQWDKLLVEISINLAKSLGICEISIQGGYNNTWVHERNSCFTLPIEKAVMRYDNLAYSLGFEYRNDENWYKKI